MDDRVWKTIDVRKTFEVSSSGTFEVNLAGNGKFLDSFLKKSRFSMTIPVFEELWENFDPE